MAGGLDAGKYFWRSGRGKCFSLDIPFYRTSEGTSSAKTKLSYLEAREYATIEQRVADAEQMLQAKQKQLENPAIASDGPRLLAAHAEMEEAQNKVDKLYGRWSELEKKKN